MGTRDHKVLRAKPPGKARPGCHKWMDKGRTDRVKSRDWKLEPASAGWGGCEQEASSWQAET